MRRIRGFRAVVLAALAVSSFLIAAGWAAGSPTRPGASLAPLKVSSVVTLPITAFPLGVSAEARDGTIYVAGTPWYTPTPPPTPIWEVIGTKATRVVASVAAGVRALTVAGSHIFAATRHGVVELDRTSGALVRQWSAAGLVPSPGAPEHSTSLSVTGDTCLVKVVHTQTVSIYRIDIASSASPILVATGSSAAWGPGGTVYFEATDHHLDLRTAKGRVKVGPLLSAPARATDLGPPAIKAVAGGRVLVTENPGPMGSGSAPNQFTYNARTLRFERSQVGMAITALVPTSIGLLDAFSPGGDLNPCSLCMARFTATGRGSQVIVDHGETLMGPQPAFLTFQRPGGQLTLVRLS
jgi:hypothetical protein